MSELTHKLFYIVGREPGKAPWKKGGLPDTPRGRASFREMVVTLAAKYPEDQLTILTVTEFGDLWPESVKEYRIINNITQ